MGETMQVNINWEQEVTFCGETDKGHSVRMDGPIDHGGRDRGARPMEVLLMGMGGCAAYDVVTILSKARQKMVLCRMQIKATRTDTVPSVFENIHLHFQVRGDDLSETHVARAVRLSAEKYCSAAAMLRRGGVQIAHSYEMVAE